MEIDQTRWQALLAAYRSACDTSPAYSIVTDAQARLTRARVDLDRHKSRKPQTGQATMVHTPEKMEADHARLTAELERRIEAEQREVQRVQALVREASAKRAGLFNLIEAVRRWAASQEPPINLPDDDASRAFGELPSARLRGGRVSLQPGALS